MSFCWSRINFGEKVVNIYSWYLLYHFGLPDPDQQLLLIVGSSRQLILLAFRDSALSPPYALVNQPQFLKEELAHLYHVARC